MKLLVSLTEFEARCVRQAASGAFSSEEDTDAVFNGHKRDSNAAIKALNSLDTWEIPDNSTVLALTEAEAGAVRATLAIALDSPEFEMNGRLGAQQTRLIHAALDKLDAGRRKAGRN